MTKYYFELENNLQNKITSIFGGWNENKNVFDYELEVVVS